MALDNVPEKDVMKSQIEFLQCLLADAGRRCGVSTERDWLTVSSRIDCEGEGFITITLPTFAKALDRALEIGRYDLSLSPSFKAKGSLPAFMRGFLDRIFDPSGVLLDDPDVVCIAAVRQFCYAFGKLKKPATPAREAAAYRAYVQCELEVRLIQFSAEWEPLRHTFNLMFRDLLAKSEKAILSGDIEFGHGPGGVADKLTANKRWEMPRWSERLQTVFDYQEHVMPTRDLAAFIERDVHFYEPGAEPPVTVTAVPKTQLTPRIIAVEPAHMQYVQQGLKNMLVPLLEGDELISPLIGFTDQAPNREMAWKSSHDGSLATLDLSEASDRVSWPLVQYLLADFGVFADAVDACRSRSADVPGLGVIPLRKFASMGSALCFPIEAMVFLAIAVHRVAQTLSVPVNRKLIKSLAGKVRVYGDDIIVPNVAAHTVVAGLESFGLKVNHGKSYWNGKFRESCGGDFYDGYWVTPVRVRKSFPTKTAHVAELTSTVALHNHLWERGWYTSAAYLRKIVERVLTDVPTDVPGDYQHYALFGPNASYKKTRWNKVLQTYEAKVSVVLDQKRRDPLEHYGALAKSLTNIKAPASSPLDWKMGLDQDHLERAGRPVASRIVPRWVQISPSS